MSSKIQSFFAPELVQLAADKAADDKEYKALLFKATRAGLGAGASIHSRDAGDVWRELADELASVAAVAVALGGPVTQQVIALAFLDAHKAAETAASAGALVQASPNDADLIAKAKEAADASKAASQHAIALDNFRARCALVNVAFKAAQTEAKRTAVQTFKTADMAKAAKRARDKIAKAIGRALAVFGFKVDFQACSCVECEIDDSEQTDADKAKAAIVRAFKLDASAAIGALMLQAGSTLDTVLRLLQDKADAARRNLLQEDAEHKEDAADKLGDKLGEPAATTSGQTGVVDLVSVANAESEADAARAKADQHDDQTGRQRKRA